MLPHAGNWIDAKSYREALEQHVPLLAWSPAYGLGRGGVGSLPIQKSPTGPSKTFAPDAIRPQAAQSLVEVTPAGVVLSAMRLVRRPSPASGRWSKCVSTNRQARRPTL